MPVNIRYREDADILQFTISYPSKLGMDNPVTKKEIELLEKNIAEKGLKVIPGLTIVHSTNYSTSTTGLKSSVGCYLLRRDAFSSIDDIQRSVLNNFGQHVAIKQWSYPKDMEYAFAQGDREALAKRFTSPNIRVNQPGLSVTMS